METVISWHGGDGDQGGGWGRIKARIGRGFLCEGCV
jgi:hypothetical protein